MLQGPYGGSLPADPRVPVRRPTGVGTFYILLDAIDGVRESRNGERVLGALVLSGDGDAGRLVRHAARGETDEDWRSLLIRLKEDEGSAQPALICCDGHRGVIKALRAIYPDAAIQISLIDRLLALGEHLHQQWRSQCLAEGRRIFLAPNRGSAVIRFRAWRDRWLSKGERGVRTLEGDLAWCLTFYRFPPTVRRTIRSLHLLRRALRAARVTPQVPSHLQAPPPQVPSPEADRSGAALPSPLESDQVIVYGDDLITDPTLIGWLQQYGRDRLRLAQTASAVTSAVGLAARLLGRGH